MARTDPWTRACDKFKEDLSDEEKRLFSAASPENLFAGTLISYQQHEANSKSHKVVKALEPFVSIVRDYGAALDVLANTYSLVLSPLWGSIRIVLRLAEEAGKFFDKVLEMFNRIADVLPRLQVYERLFANHDRLLDMIFTAYLDILNFCIDAKGTLRKRGSLFKHLYWRPFQLRFQASLVSMRNHLKSVEKEAMLSHMIETSEERGLAKRDDVMGKEMIKAQKRTQFLNSISTVAYEKIHRRASKLRHAGSCEWLLRTDQYRAWINNATSAALSVVGIPGCGKTILASSLVDAFANDGTPRRPVLYHYCDYSDPVSLNFQAVVGTLLKQLLLYMSSLPPVIESQIARLSLFNVQCPSDKDLLALLDAVMKEFDEVIVVLDAIDECDTETQKDVVEFVKHLHSAQVSVVRCIIFSREEAKLTSGFQAYPILQISSTATSGDISTFVQDSVTARIDGGDLVLRAPELKELITSTLIEGANGMFLWVRLQLDEICEASSDKEIRSILQDLPIGLKEIYKRILRKICTNPIKRATAEKIFRWLAYAKRTLELQELLEAIAFSPADKSWSAESIPDGSRALQACKNLVVLDEETQQVRFVHHTVRQLLLSEDLFNDVKLRIFWFNDSRGDFTIAEVIWAYLCFSDFERQLARVGPEARAQRLDPVRAQESLMKMPHEMPLGTLLVTVWKAFRGSQIGHEVPTLKFPEVPIMKEESLPKGLEKFHLLNYAIQHWLSHAKNYLASWHTFSVSDSNLESLVFDKKLPFRFRPWGDHRGNPQFPHMPMFRWAVQNGHVALLSLLGYPRRSPGGIISNSRGQAYSPILQRYCIEEIDHDRSPLLWVVEYGLDDILTALNDIKIRSFRPHTLRQLLCATARQPSGEVFDWVMAKTTDQVDANDMLVALLAAIETERNTITDRLALATKILIDMTQPFEINAKPRLYLSLTTVSFCKILDWALTNFSSSDLATVLTTHVLVPSLTVSEGIINYPYVFLWAVKNDKAEFMRHFMRALPFETIASTTFWEAAESVASRYDQEKEVVQIIWSYLQPIDPAKYFNQPRRPLIPKAIVNGSEPRHYLLQGPGGESTAKGSLLHYLNEEMPELPPAKGMPPLEESSLEVKPHYSNEADTNGRLVEQET